MANKIIEIPGRLHSVATEGQVAGANEIYDDSLNKNQETINAEVQNALGTGGTVDRKIEAAIETALDDVAFIDESSLSPAVVPSFDPESQTVHVTAQTLSEAQKAQVRTNIGLNDVDTKIQAEASARQKADQNITNTVNSAIIRQDSLISREFAAQDAVLANQDEKMNNMQATINEKQLEIGAVQTDDEPTPESGNHLTSGTIAAAYGHYEDNPEYIKIETDTEGKVLGGRKIDGTKVENLPIEANAGLKVLGTLDTPGATYTIQDIPELIQVLVTGDGKKIAWIDKDGSVGWAIGVPEPIKNYVQDNLKLYSNKEEDKLYRSYILEHMMSVGIPVSEERAKTAVPTGCDVDSDGNVYLALQCGYGYDENVAVGRDFCTLTIFNLLDPEATKKYYDFVAYGDTYTRNGETITILKGAQVDVKKIDDNTLRMYGNVRVGEDVGGPWAIVYRDFDLATKTFGEIHECTITVNGTNYLLEGANAETLVSLLHNETFPADEHDPSSYKYNSVYFNQNAIKIDNYWYSSFIIGSGGHVILRTDDLINWKFVTDTPIGYYCEEVTLNYYNGYIYAVNRGLRSTYTSAPYPYFGKVLRYNMSQGAWDSNYITLEDSYGNKTSAAIKDGMLYCFLGVEKLNGLIDGYPVGRNGKSMYVVDCESMTLTNRWDFTMQRGCCDTMLVNLNCNLFMFASMDPRGFMKWPIPASVVRMSGCVANAFSCRTNNHVVPATFTEFTLNSAYWTTTERVSAPSYSETEIYSSDSIVNMDGCSTVSFKCINDNTSGKVPAMFDSYTLNSNWARVDYNESYEVFQAGTNYTQRSESQGRAGVLFSYVDNRMFN